MDMSQESYFTQEISRKMPRPKNGNRILCEPAQSNALGHVAKAILQEKNRSQMEHPDQAPAFTCG